MKKERLLKILKSEPNDINAIGMILSNYSDFGHSELGGMISVKQFNKVAECLIEWWGDNNPKKTHCEVHSSIELTSIYQCPVCNELLYFNKNIK